MSADFIGICSDETETAKTIKEIYENKNCLVDTHTAVALSATFKYKNINETERRILTVSTASAYKFAGDVYCSLTGVKPENDLEALDLLNKLTSAEIPSPLSDIAKREIIYGESIAKELMEESVREFAKA